MKPNCEESNSGQLNSMDRFSNLPDSILHRIISYLGRKESGRTCILSKRWGQISATNPILQFFYYDFPSGNTASFEDYIDVTLRRYGRENLGIKSLTIVFPDAAEIKNLEVGLWQMTAILGQVENLILRGPFRHELRAILSWTPSLRYFSGFGMSIPYCSSVNFASLESLILDETYVIGALLNHVISSCVLLKDLSLTFCHGIIHLLIPSWSRLESVTLVDSIPEGGTVSIKTSSFTWFQYSGDPDSYQGWGWASAWAVKSKSHFLRNLTWLVISDLGITDEVLARLLPRLTLLETLHISDCHALRIIGISGVQLKEVRLTDCSGLLDIRIDSLSLKKFVYKGHFNSSLSFHIGSQASCDISLQIRPCDLDSKGFSKLKKILTGLPTCNVLKVVLLDQSKSNEPMKDECDNSEFKVEELRNNVHFRPPFGIRELKGVCDYIKFNEKELGNVHLGPSCDIRELKLNLSSRTLSKSSISAFLDGLFWTCHPAIISFRVDLGNPSRSIEPSNHQLKIMASSWRHPLKRIEIDEANCCSLIKSRKFYVKSRLYW